MGTFRLGLHETKSGRGRKNGSIGLSGLTGSAEIKKKKRGRKTVEIQKKKFGQKISRGEPFALWRGKKLKRGSEQIQRRGAAGGGKK